MNKYAYAVHDIDDTFQDISRELIASMNDLKEHMDDVATRCSFHRHRALDGVEYIIEHDFIRGWQVTYNDHGIHLPSVQGSM